MRVASVRPGPAHERDVNPRNHQNARAAPRRGRHGADGIFAAEIDDRMAGQKFRQMFRHANRPHARPAAAVRNAKSLVQIDVANVRADVAGTGTSPTCAFMLAPSI